MSNYYKKDDVYLNSLWGFDYAFCHSDCTNKKCGRNHYSKSFKAMGKTYGVYTASDFSSKCKKYKKPKKVAE